MNAAERNVMERVYGVVNAMSGHRPRNPADVRHLTEAARQVTDASRALLMALANLNARDFNAAHSYLADAEQSLGIFTLPPSPGASS